MNFESFIAKRYLASKHKINFITIISFISIAGITVGVAALIIVISVFNGFGSLVTSYLMNLDPHIRITAISNEGEKEIIKLEDLLKTQEEILAYSPFIEGKVLAYNKGVTQVLNLKGVTDQSVNSVYLLDDNMVDGDVVINQSSSNVIVGLRLADKLQVFTGDTILLISPSNIEQALTQLSLPLSRKVTITGVFSSKNNEYDDGYIFCSLKDAQYLFGYKNSFQGYDIKLDNIDNSNRIKKALQTQLDKNNFSVNTWYDFHQELYAVMQVERWTAYIILSLIIAVATFNILGSLSMSVIEKRRDIGILRSMGVTEKSVVKIFMFEGLLIGIIGTLLGVMIGYLVCYIQLKYNIYPLDPSQYKIDSLPIELRISDFFFISGIAMLLSFLASLYPAKRAAKVNPISAIKWE
ncbi:MAG: FtsX-like permease family protein [Ignavibacteriaceae bacterium]|nr:FtsX-like permease family protein [Ignavibacteriaceae bacterium]